MSTSTTSEAGASAREVASRGGPAPPTGSRPPLMLEVLALLLAVVLSIGTALQLAATGDPRLVLLVAGGFAGLLLLTLAVVRFAAFVPVVLAVRTLVDLAHPVADSTRDSQSSGLPATLLAVLFMATALTWLAAQRRAGQPLVWSGVSTCATALVLAGAVSVLGSARPLTSAAELARILAAMLMFVVVEQLADSAPRARRLLLAVYLSALAPLAVVVVQALTSNGVMVTDGVSRVRGTFVHPNALGLYLVLLILTSTALARHVRLRLRLALLVVVAAGSAGLVLSYSRGAWVALVAGLLVIGVVQSKRLIAAMVAAVALVLVLFPSTQARLTDLDEGRTDRGTAGNSFVWRVDYWQQALALPGDNPLSGIGLKMTQYTTSEAKAPHNDFLRVYVEAGVLGLTAYLALLGALARRARSALRRTAGTGRGLERGLAVGFAGCLGAFAVFSIGGNVVSQVVVLWYFLTLAALARPQAARVVPAARPEPVAI